MLVVAGGLAFWGGIAFRFPGDGSQLPYAAELCEVRKAPLDPEPNRRWSDPEPGYGYRGSPAGRYLALSRDDRRGYHSVYVWDEEARVLHRVVSVQEGDPGSGASHEYRWSRDGRVLLIYGSGALPQDPAGGELSLAYLPADDRLYRLPACH